MKQFLTILVLTFSLYSLNAQEVASKQLKSIEIPAEFNSHNVKLGEANELLTESMYFEKIKGLVVITFDKDRNVVKILASQNIPSDLLIFNFNSTLKTAPENFLECKGDCQGGIWCQIKCAVEHLL